MTEKELEAIVSRLDSARQHRKLLQLTKAQAEMEAINKCADAYYDGLCDLAKEIRRLLPKEDV